MQPTIRPNLNYQKSKIAKTLSLFHIFHSIKILNIFNVIDIKLNFKKPFNFYENSKIYSLFIFALHYVFNLGQQNHTNVQIP